MFDINKDNIRSMILIADPTKEEAKKVKSALFMIGPCLTTIDITGDFFSIEIARINRLFFCSRESMSLPALAIMYSDFPGSEIKLKVLEGIDNIFKALRIKEE